MDIATGEQPKRADARRMRAIVRPPAWKAPPRLEIRLDGMRSVEVPVPVAIVGILALSLAVLLAAIDPGAIRFSSLNRQAAALSAWERHDDARLAARIDALEWPLRQLRREALERGIAPTGDLAPSLCDGAPEAHLEGHLAEVVRLSTALAARADRDPDPAVLLPSRSPIDLSGTVALTTTRWSRDLVRVSSRQGERADPFSGDEREHRGLDIAAPLGTPVIAPADGVVEFAGRVDPNADQARSLLGSYVWIRHGSTGIRTLYAHLSRIDVKIGQAVRAGDRIGAVGTSGHSTAPHLHYQVMKDGVAENPLAYIADVILVRDGKSVWYTRRPPEARK